MIRVSAASALVLLSAGNVMAYEALAVTPADEHILRTGQGTVQILARSGETDGKLGIVISDDQYGGPGRSVRLSGTSPTFFVLEGVYEFHLGPEVFEAEAGTLVSVDAGQTYGYFSKGKGRLMTIYSPGGFEQFFSEWANKGIGPGPELEALERKFGLTRDSP